MDDLNTSKNFSSDVWLESLLDEESDEEFGLPRFQEHFADSVTPVVLKDWSAKDFASIYVRFKPHLERHAKRFLNNPYQVEEVVQDAFLYLMTTLPELDSEVGVLKFLKWKTKMLAIDVIRANSRLSFSPLDERGDFEADTPEVSQELERADDAAIVSLALAKLLPRQREAIIATLYEEKSSQVVASQMNLSENALRQLLFRSRSAFKKALIGEAETAGLSMSGILSIAARKAAAETGKTASIAGAFILVLAVSVGVIVNLAPISSGEIISQPAIVSEDAGAPNSPGTAASGQVAPVEAIPNEDPLEPSASQLETAQVSGETIATVEAPENQSRQVPNEAQEQAALASESLLAQRSLAVGSLQEALNGDTAANLAFSGMSLSALKPPATGSVELSTGTGLTGQVFFDSASINGIQSAWFEISVDGGDFISVPNVSFSQKTSRQDGSIFLEYVATDLLIGDASGEFSFLAITDTVVSRSVLRVNLLVGSNGELLSSSISLTPRI